jgi:hypothetical protein
MVREPAAARGLPEEKPLDSLGQADGSRQMSIRRGPARRGVFPDGPGTVQVPNEGANAMQYIVLIYGSEKGWSSMSKAGVEQMYAEYRKYSEDLAKAGVIRGGSELKPTSTATTVRVRGGKRQVTDGPFAETKEQLGGFYLIDVPNLEAALDWAARCPSAHDGSIEVRPLAQGPQA